MTGITFTLVTGDINNDSDIDLITWEALQGILFYENNGTGTLSFSDTILQHSDIFRSVIVHDFDNDNDNDIYTTIGQTGQLIWMQNNGAGIYTPYSVIHTEPGQLVYEGGAADLNTDGAKEIIWGSKFLAYHLNLFPTAIKDFSTEKNVIIYPNPNTGRFYIKNKSDEK